jgi:DedD protein
MDRRVKERLVGASILLVLIVLVVPELLSGPAAGPAAAHLPVSAPEQVRNVTVDLATSKPPEPVVEAAPASSAPTQGAHGGTENPASSANTGASPSTGEAGGVDVVPPASSTAPTAMAAAPPAPLESPPPPPTSKATTAKTVPPGHGWAVQLGSFASRANADKLVRQVKAQGFGVYVLSGGSGAAARYRVRVGPMADRNAAAQAAAKLKSSGHLGSLVAPSS